ncbi:hypothetical protein QEN19_004284 [Hanseniaspora menglaensis]
MPSKSKKQHKNDEDNLLLNDDEKHRELSITSELLFGGNRSVEPFERTPSVGASIGRGFSIVNSASNTSHRERRKSVSKSKSTKPSNASDFNNSSTGRRPSENLEPFQFKHPFGAQPNTFIKNTSTKTSKKDSIMQPRSNSISSLLGAAAMMNPDSKRNSIVSLNFNDLEKSNNNQNQNNATSAMKPPKKLPVNKSQSQNNHDIMDIHKAPSMSEFDFFNSGRKDSFKAPSFIPQSLNDLDSDLFMNRKNSNVRGSVFDNGARFSRTFSSGMQQFLNQNFGTQPGSENNNINNITNNTNNNIISVGHHPQRRRESSIGASHFTDFIKGNENAISDDDDDDHHGHTMRSLHNHGEEMSADDMRQLAAAAALAGGVPLSQQHGKQSFRSSFAGGVSLQTLLQQENNPNGNNRLLRRSIRANSNTPLPLGTPPLHAFGGSFNMMNLGMNVAVTSDEEDNSFNDFEGFSQTSNRDQVYNVNSHNINPAFKKTKAKKRVTKPKNTQANMKKLNKQAADAAFEAAAHATSLATMNKQDKESPATKRRGKKLENKPVSSSTNGFVNSSTTTLSLGINNIGPKKINSRKSLNSNAISNNMINENKRFIGEAMISEFDSLNGNLSSRADGKSSFGRKLKPGDFLTTTLTTSMEPATKFSSGNRKNTISAGKAKKIVAETKKKVSKPKHSKHKQTSNTVVASELDSQNGNRLSGSESLDDAAAAAALQIIGKSESPDHSIPLNDSEIKLKKEESIESSLSEDELVQSSKSLSETSITKSSTSGKSKKLVSRPKMTPPVKHTPKLLAEPIRVANPIIPQTHTPSMIDPIIPNSIGQDNESGNIISDPTISDDKKDINSNENVAVLGATNVDQLMLILQARQKGFQQQLKKTIDGKLDIFSAPDIIPPAVELVGGVDKPKVVEDYEQSLKNSQHSHTPNGGRKMYVCQYCHKQFSQTTHLEVHVRSHVGLKPYSCEHCGKSFTQGGNLRTHIRLHTGEQPFACKVCDKRFSRKGNLQAHMLTHDNLKPFICELDSCEKGFTQLGNLKSHQNKFHLETLNSLTMKLAEGLDGKESAEELKALEYLGGLYKNSNRGIKGRGKKT